MKKGFIILICTLSFILVLVSIGFINPSSRTDIFSVSQSIGHVLERVSSYAQSFVSLFDKSMIDGGLFQDFDFSSYRVTVYSYSHSGTVYYIASLRPRLFSGVKHAFCCTDPLVGSFEQPYSPTGEPIFDFYSYSDGGKLYQEYVSPVSLDSYSIFYDCHVYINN